MSQEQPRKPQADQLPGHEPIRYGDVFNVSGELASETIAPQDAATMQAAENLVFGQTQRGGPAAVMQSAANLNQRAGLVGRDDTTDIVRDQGVTISESKVGANRVITESVGGQVVGQYTAPQVPMESPGSVLDRDAITVGEALEAAALSAGDKPVDQTDAAAIQAAEMRATGKNETQPGGLGSAAQSAATQNERTGYEGGKTTLSDVLTDAKEKLRGDKAVTRQDAEGVIAAELRNNPNMSTTPGGVAESLAAAAMLNQNQDRSFSN